MYIANLSSTATVLWGLSYTHWLWPLYDLGKSVRIAYIAEISRRVLLIIKLIPISVRNWSSALIIRIEFLRRPFGYLAFPKRVLARVQIFWRELKADVREHAHARHHCSWQMFSYKMLGFCLVSWKLDWSMEPLSCPSFVVWHQSLSPQIHADLSSWQSNHVQS